MKILLTRHGQTTGNLEGRITGHIDVSLTALGKAQAKLLCDYIQENYMVDAIYTSMLSRAQNTIKPLAQSLNVSPILDKRINELNAGEWEGILVSDLKQNCPQDLIRWSKEPRTFFCPNGESFENVYDRVLEFLLEVVKTDAKTVCVCAHGGVIRCILCYLKYGSVDEISKISWGTNASVTEIDYENGKFSIVKEFYDSFLDQLKSGYVDAV